MDPFLIIGILFFMAFICEYVDSTLGMGYGTTMTPILLLMGYEPLAVVPAILLSELLTGGFAAFMHHRVGNVDFDFRRDSEHRILKKMKILGYIPKSNDSKIAFVLAACSVIGAVAAVILAFHIPKVYLRIIIGSIVLIMGILILVRRNAVHRFSWKKILGLGVVASFNKGLSGGGYGPLVTSGQILSGVNSKSSIAITSIAESFTCLVGVIAYLILGADLDWNITLPLVIGSFISVPFCALTVKKIRISRFTAIVGIATMALGLFTLYKVVF